MIEILKRNIPFAIFGTDISTKASESAKKAHYTYSVRNMDASLKRKYFIEKDGNFILKENIKKYVKIDFMNLMDQMHTSFTSKWISFSVGMFLFILTRR